MNDSTQVPQPLRRLESSLTRAELADQVVADRPAVGNAARQAAVLALFSVASNDEPVLTVLERAHSLRHHAGQIAFPGGGVDPGDPSVEDAALREADEEIGLRRDTVRLLGSLPAAHVAVSGFDVTTVVGWWVDPHEVYARDRAEVESVHHIPVSDLVDPANRRIARHPSGYHGPAFLADELFIWGLTAHLLDGLLDLAGWARTWNRADQVEIPARFMRERSRTDPGTGAATH